MKIMILRFYKRPTKMIRLLSLPKSIKEFLELKKTSVEERTTLEKLKTEVTQEILLHPHALNVRSKVI